MARRKDSPPRRQPDRSIPSEKTLLDLAHARMLFASPTTPPPPSSSTSRILDTALSSFSLAMLHFTFDLLVQHQYGSEIVWLGLAVRTVRAWLRAFLPPSVLRYPTARHRHPR
ncbi:hypothetical protein XA68_17903 [Ophiocordyceps unilateralis]|uniref:Uncharacterized protein n=1 Tax=Ophiocordyceps unilateralis TaxID=268505 RepID=A0A2A9P465_OPHUN|nr:hypothetical protein XA68_17903 [Ophiocordyceps unilateralis]